MARAMFVGRHLLPVFWTILLVANGVYGCTGSAECQLPDCLCMDTKPPNGLNVEDIPHLVFLTFDDSLSDWMISTYSRIFDNRLNPDGCPIAGTFYVTHENSDYRLVNEFYNKGHEIASHTVTHKADYDYWKNQTIDFWVEEVNQQREIIHTYSNIPLNQIQGFRAPYLQTGGDATFDALQSLEMMYDSSLPTVNFVDPPIWPFTMDNGVTHDCVVPPCGEKPHPGLWDVPMVAFQANSSEGIVTVCSMADSCFPPDVATNLTVEEVYLYFSTNFDRYKPSKTPFGIYQHIYWFGGNPNILQGFLRFLDYLSTFNDVFIVPVGKGIKWLKNPLKLGEVNFGCGNTELALCPTPQSCFFNESVPGGERTMGSCITCPDAYPWLTETRKADNSTNKPNRAYQVVFQHVWNSLTMLLGFISGIMHN